MVEQKKHIYFQLFVKKILDYFIASVLLIFTAPVFLVTTIAIKLTSKGPVIFKQIRIGKDRKPFVFYKFRSMYAGSSPEIHREYIQRLMTDELEESVKKERIYKLSHDSRVTPVGRFIRRTNIDELPQLFNVLKGDMSMVGPRPAIPYELKYYDEEMFKRFSVKSGITGLWQVSPISKYSFREMIVMDIFYVNNWSLCLDLKILFKTIFVVFKRHTTFKEGEIR